MAMSGFTCERQSACKISISMCLNECRLMSGVPHLSLGPVVEPVLSESLHVDLESAISLRESTCNASGSEYLELNHVFEECMLGVRLHVGHCLALDLCMIGELPDEGGVSVCG